MQQRTSPGFLNSMRIEPLTLALFLLISPILSTQLLAQGNSGLENSVATIERTQGFTAIQRNGQWLLAETGDQLLGGDNVYSGDKSRIEFDFRDGTSTTLGEFSNFSIDNFNWTEGQDNPSAEFSLHSGVFRMITGQITQVESPRFAVNTPLASIGIRGTDFWGGYLDADKIDVFFVEGEHSIEVVGQGQTAVLESPTQGVTFSADGSVSDVVFWGTPKIERAVNTVTFD